jgi:hypothetical protein
LLAALRSAIVLATTSGLATTSVIATATTTIPATKQVERKRLGRDTQETDRHHGGQHSALHGTDS